MDGLLLIGCGAMGSALLKGWCADPSLPGPFVVVAPREASVAPFMQDPRVRYVARVEDLTQVPCVVVCALKPSLVAQVLPQYGPLLNKETLFMSVAAGVPLSTYARLLGAAHTTVRVMPNLASSVGWGQSLFCAHTSLDAFLLEKVTSLLKVLGHVIPVENEDMLERLTPLVGCGPAYLFRFMEALSLATEHLGVNPKESARITRDLIIGCGRFLEASSKDVAELRRDVTSPQGVTHAGLVVFNEDQGLDHLVVDVLNASYARALEMGKEYGGQ